MASPQPCSVSSEALWSRSLDASWTNADVKIVGSLAMKRIIQS